MKSLPFFAAFFLALLLFVTFSTQVSFHDAHEYITVTQELAGLAHTQPATIHSLLYPFFLAQFVKFLPLYWTVKALNALWIFLTGVLLYLSTRKLASLLLWMFSPLAWYMSIHVSPLLPASFFLLLAYVLFRRYEQEKSGLALLGSGVALGLAPALYGPAILAAGLFFPIFCYRHSFKAFVASFVGFLSGFGASFLLDAVLFSVRINEILVPFPFYSFIRYYGTNALVFLGLYSSKVHPFTLEQFWLIVIVAPLALLLLVRPQRWMRRELLFVALLALFLMVRGSGNIKYYLLFAPLAVYLLSFQVSKTQVSLNALLALPFILLWTVPFFGDTPDARTLEDLQALQQDFQLKEVQSHRALYMSSLSWDQGLPFYYWTEEVDLQAQNQPYFQRYVLTADSSLTTYKQLELQLNLKRDPARTIPSDLPLLGLKTEKLYQDLPVIKCYQELCLWKAPPT